MALGDSGSGSGFASAPAVVTGVVESVLCGFEDRALTTSGSTR